MDFTQQDAETLAVKLAELDCTAAERAALNAVFDAASHEVAGFAMGQSQPGGSAARTSGTESGRYLSALGDVLGKPYIIDNKVGG